MAVKVPYGARRRRWRIAIPLAALVLAVIVVLLSASSGEDRESVRPKLESLKSTLDLLTIEYREAATGTRGGLESEYEAAKNLTERALSLYQEVRRDLDTLSPELSGRLRDTLQELGNAVNNRESPERIEALAREAMSVIDSILRLLEPP